MSVGKSKVMMFERKGIEVVDFRNPYSVMCQELKGVKAIFRR